MDNLTRNIERECAQAIRQQQSALAEAIVARQYEQQPEVWRPFGDPGRAKSVRDAGYHLTYLAEALDAQNPALFVEYLAWCKVLFAGLRFGAGILPTTVECTAAVLSAQLPADLAAVASKYLDAGLRRLPEVPTTPASLIEPDAPLASLARAYLDALLRADRHAAGRLILDAVEQGTPIKDIYLNVFQPVQREIGRLWQTNQISVAQEHYSTAATQLVMSMLYPRIFDSPRKGHRLVAACVGGELHEIGARMVADFFEMEGWDTYFLGANTPTESVLRTVDERRADVLAVSATMTFHVSRVADLIAAFHRAGLDRHTRVLVGGYPFNIAPGLWQQIGADGYAPDAQQAIETAERMIAG
ncbi:MAG TPA: cobalamin-dependent protein [Anaerolineae bacterium]|nr:cobalamin-dependent protein [Anaerolineae bacterium]HQK15073.1 cobalamin-dependent protein [Anaerolineae bacterium]